MRHLSTKIRNLEESQTLLLTQKARLLQEAGVDVVSLTAGEPDFAASRADLEKGIDRLLRGLQELQ
jgi:aspartate aminotransferase